jgi:hypothetical protein
MILSLYLGKQFSQPLLSPECGPAQASGDPSYQDTGQRKHYQDQDCEFETDGEQKNQVDQDGQRIPEKHLQGTHDRSLHFLYIVGYPGDHVPFAGLRIIRKRQFQHLGIDLVPYVPHYVGSYGCQSIIGSEKEPVLQQAECDHQYTHQYQGPGSSVFPHDHTHIVIEGLQKGFSAEFERCPFGDQRLILEKDPEEGDDHGKGEQRKEGSQYIVDNILDHIPLVGPQVSEQTEEPSHML